jgi:hypothetical protein
MGTRNVTMVISKEGETKIAQYGQWDGGPSVNGKKILEFLLSADMKRFENRVSKLSWLSPEQAMRIDQDKDWVEHYPYLSRDCGTEILSAVCYGKMKISMGFQKTAIVDTPVIVGLTNNEEFIADGLSCEWAYVIDLKKQTFEVYKGRNQKPLSKSQRFHKLLGEDGYQPAICIKKYKLNALPSVDQFLIDMNKKLK